MSRPQPLPLTVRPIAPSDRTPLAQLLSRVVEFTSDEVSCALELIDCALTPNHPDYRALVAEATSSQGAQVLGYVLFGPTPMTDGTFDLYWIASAPEARGQGVGKRLVAAMEAALREQGARLVRIETSSTEAYGATRAFYDAIRCTEEARIRDFYRPGDDLVILTKRI